MGNIELHKSEASDSEKTRSHAADPATGDIQRIGSGPAKEILENGAHIRFLQAMDLVNNAIAQADDLDEMLASVLQTLLDIFRCDRAWLVYPCDPDSDYWEVKMERTTPNWPGATQQGVQFPMTPDAAELPRMCISNEGAIRFDGQSGPELPDVVKSFGVQSQVCMAIYPKVDKPWMFGVHHCEIRHTYSAEESRIFEQIGHRIADSLNTLIVMRELKKSQALHEEAQRLAGIGHWEFDIGNRQITWSDEVHRMFETDIETSGISYDEFIERVHPDDREMVDKAFSDSLQSKKPYMIDHRLLMPDGRIKYVHELCRTDYDQDGRPQRSVGTVQDISKRKMAENALWESQQRLQAILDNSTTVIYVKDVEGKYLLVNRQYEHLFGKTSAEMLGLVDHAVFPAKIADALRINDLRVITSKKPMEYEEIVPHNDGDHVYISMKFPLFDSEGSVYAVCGISTDITSHKRSEELEKMRLMELGHLERLSIIGEMSAHIAHELHQPLSAIRSYSEVCAGLIKTGSPDMRAAGEIINKIEKQAERAGKVISKVQHFAKRQRVQSKKANINSLVQDTLKLMEIETDRRPFKPVTKLGRKLPMINADTILIQQVLVNLLRNAMKSMETSEGSDWILMLQTRLCGKGFIEISVQDNGIGVSEDDIEQIFDPFHSQDGEGMGLGLAISRLIVESHGGHLWAENNKYCGMTFRFTLPLQGVANDE